MSRQEQQVIDAVLYALREGCFFPVPEPKPTAPISKWIQWGAMRHLHDAIADLTKGRG